MNKIPIRFSLSTSFLIVLLCFTYLTSQGQNFDKDIANLEVQIANLDQQKQKINQQIETTKLNKIQYDLLQVGLPSILPGEEIIKHAAYCLVYSEEHEQPRWVAHIIIPDVIKGTVFRTNDFRPDPLIKTGSAVEEDYFLKTMNKDSTYSYDGFGYDRGHQAPSADFRWSQTALSESYYYSNMAPQLPDFNRGSWGDLEDALRGYLYRYPTTQLYIVTGPILSKDLPVIERGKNKVSIPKEFYKVALDLKNKKAIGFIMPNQKITAPLKTFAVPINEIEERTGIDFFSKIPTELQENLESQVNTADWLPETSSADVEPLHQETLQRNQFNTVQAKNWMNKSTEISVCGTVVGTRVSKAGNILINLDKQFPNQVFTVFIKKEFIPNFSYKPEKELAGKVICVKGRVIDLGGTPSVFIENERELSIEQTEKEKSIQ